MSLAKNGTTEITLRPACRLRHERFSGIKKRNKVLSMCGPIQTVTTSRIIPSKHRSARYQKPAGAIDELSPRADDLSILATEHQSDGDPIEAWTNISRSRCPHDNFCAGSHRMDDCQFRKRSSLLSNKSSRMGYLDLALKTDQNIESIGKTIPMGFLVTFGASEFADGFSLQS